MPTNKYDFQVGDIIVEENEDFSTPSHCYMYYILGVDAELPAMWQQGEGETGRYEFMKKNYIPYDCSLTVLYTSLSGSMFADQFDSMAEGVVNKEFFFSKRVWENAQNIKKIRGNKEYRFTNGKWKKLDNQK